jgi:hypothetical protein
MKKAQRIDSPLGATFVAAKLQQREQAPENNNNEYNEANESTYSGCTCTTSYMHAHILVF